MKKILLIGILLMIGVESFGQINPVVNLTWDQYYISPNNFFILEWEEPESPHDELIGYNVYREDELYRFQTEKVLYNLEQGSNCEEDFLFFNNGEGFFAHVTAVYDPGAIESGYIQTVYVEGPLLNIEEFEKNAVRIYPNPTSGLIYIDAADVTKVQVFDISGKIIKEIKNTAQIDVSGIAQGIYLLKLFVNEGTVTHKIIVQ